MIHLQIMLLFESDKMKNYFQLKAYLKFLRKQGIKVSKIIENDDGSYLLTDTKGNQYKFKESENK